VTTLLEQMMARTGRTKVPQYAKKSFGYRAVVQRSAEYLRIAALPTREWDTEAYTNELIQVLTSELKTPQGNWTLNKIQAASINDIILYGGALLPVGVGQGKALISLLTPVVLNAARPVLFVPASLREQTNEIVLPQMRKLWQLHPGLKVIGYSELSLEKNAEMLWQLRPDLIVLDECDEIKNKSAGRTKRLTRYFRDYPNTKCVAMSGTISNRSLKDYAHIAHWCLKHNSPLPLSWQELTIWSDAIDEKVPDERRVAPGVLENFCIEGENVRQGFRRRLTSTPGVIASAADDLGTALRIFKYDLDVPGIVWDQIENMRSTWETPNGETFSEAIDLWRHIRELSFGFFYRWDPSAPSDWLDARREWKSYVRETLKTNRRNLDTELQVWNECARTATVLKAWQDWRDIKDTFKPNPVAEWISDFALKVARIWLLERRWKSRGAGICWVEHVEFGRKLAEVSGLPYFGAGDSSILTTTEPAIIASVSAHGKGKNLQRYNRSLITMPSASGKTWEQVLGRLHRQGQKSDAVIYDVFLHVDELQSALVQARADAIYLEDTLGNRQKLNYADIVL